MSLPEPPKYHSWRVEKSTTKKDAVQVKLVHAIDGTVAARSVSTAGMQSWHHHSLMEDSFVKAVEDAAYSILGQLDHDQYVDTVLEEQWPRS